MSTTQPGPDGDDARRISPAGEPAPRTAPPEKDPGPAASPRRDSGFDADGHLKSSRSGALYTGLIVAAILTILVLVFIVQNSEGTPIRFLGFEGSLPTGVAILLAAVVGMLIVAVPGSIRIAQLRRSLTKNAKRGRDGA